MNDPNREPRDSAQYYQDIARDFPPLSGEEIRALIIEAQQLKAQGRDEEAREIAWKVAMHNLRFVIRSANNIHSRIRRSPISLSDLVSIGLQALVEAVFTFNPEYEYEQRDGSTKKIEFLSYADRPMQAAMWNLVGEYMNWAKSADEEHPVVINIDDYKDDRGRPRTITDRSIAEQRFVIEDEDVMRWARTAARKLKEPYRRAVILYFGLSDGVWEYYPRDSLELIAMDLRVSKEKARQILHDGIKGLERLAQKEGVRGKIVSVLDLEDIMDPDNYPRGHTELAR